ILTSFLIYISATVITVILTFFSLVYYIFNFLMTSLLYTLNYLSKYNIKYINPLTNVLYYIKDDILKQSLKNTGKLVTAGDKNMYKFINRNLLELSLDIPYKKNNMYILSKTNTEMMLSYYSYALVLKSTSLESLKGLTFVDVFDFVSEDKVVFNKNFMKRYKEIKKKLGKKELSYEELRYIDVYYEYSLASKLKNDNLVDMSKVHKPLEEAKKYAGYKALVNLSPLHTPSFQNNVMFDIIKSFRYFQIQFIIPTIDAVKNFFVILVESISYLFNRQKGEEYAVKKLANRKIKNQLSEYLKQTLKPVSVFTLSSLLTVFMKLKYQDYVLYNLIEDLIDVSGKSQSDFISRIIKEISELISDLAKLNDACNTIGKEDIIDDLIKKYNVNVESEEQKCISVKNKLMRAISNDFKQLRVTITSSDKYKYLSDLYNYIYCNKLQETKCFNDELVKFSDIASALDHTSFDRDIYEYYAEFNGFKAFLRKLDRVSNIYRFYALSKFDKDIKSLVLKNNTKYSLEEWYKWDEEEKATFLMLVMAFLEEDNTLKNRLLNVLNSTGSEFYKREGDNEFYRLMSILTLVDSKGNPIDLDPHLAQVVTNSINAMNRIREIYNDKSSNLRGILGSLSLAIYENTDIIPGPVERFIEKQLDDKSLRIFEDREPTASDVVSQIAPPTLKKAVSYSIDVIKGMTEEPFSPFNVTHEYDMFKKNVRNMRDDIYNVLDYLKRYDTNNPTHKLDYTLLQLKVNNADILFLNKYSASFVYAKEEKIPTMEK
ncbi:MAG: hypothetical protein QXF12_05380, partial [Candidatus Aenigmatarchaeota archaeon]